MGPAIFIMLASYSGCHTTVAVWMFTIAMGFMGTFYCGMKVNALDLSANFAGIIMAITNGLGAIAGIVTPYLTGALTGNVSVLLILLQHLSLNCFAAYCHRMENSILDFVRYFYCH